MADGAPDCKFGSVGGYPMSKTLAWSLNLGRESVRKTYVWRAIHV